MKTFLLAMFLGFGSLTFAHKFFISIADMEYNEDKQKINVSLKVTAHDFELVLRRKFKKDLHLEEVEDSSSVGKYYQAYLNHNFKLYNDGVRLPQVFLGKEVTNREDLYFYFSFINVTNPAMIKVVSNLLSSVSDVQQNIVHYKYQNQTKSVTLLPSQNEAEIKFD
ncbi:MAG: hypothetical protein ACI857_000649 [Arenicella sp.]|jgi:hypothetical protein